MYQLRWQYNSKKISLG